MNQEYVCGLGLLPWYKVVIVWEGAETEMNLRLSFELYVTRLPNRTGVEVGTCGKVVTIYISGTGKRGFRQESR